MEARKRQRALQRQPPELQPREKFDEREDVLNAFVRAGNLTLSKTIAIFETFKALMLPPANDSDDEEEQQAEHNMMFEDNQGEHMANATKKRNDDKDQPLYILAHIFLREIGRLLPSNALKNGLDELLFINFDIEYIGKIDIREFLVELACCSDLNLTIPQMVHVVFLVYGKVTTSFSSSSSSSPPHRISAGLLAGLMHRGTESTRALVQTVEKFLSALDYDNDGTITWHEFLGAVYSDSSILASFRDAYSKSRRSRMLGVMMFSPLNRFLRRVNLDWLSLTKIWNEMATTSAQYKVVSSTTARRSSIVHSDPLKNMTTAANESEHNSQGNRPRGSEGVSFDNNNNAMNATENFENLNGELSMVLLNYSQFKSIIKPYFGKARPGDAPLLSDLFEVAVGTEASYVDKQGHNMAVADCHRFVIDLSAALEDAAPSMGSATIQRARFYFMILDLDWSGTIDYDEVYEVISRGQSVDLARHILHGRQLMRQLAREEDGTVTEETFVAASRMHPTLLWRVVQRYPRE